MIPEQYAASQAAVTAGLAAYVQRFASFFAVPILSLKDWIGLLQIMFPEVQRRYAESARLGRDFYDYQRALHHPELPRNERLLSDVQFDWFVKNMEPARRAMSQADAPQSAVTRMSLTAVREVEMAARRQIVGAVNNDEALEEKIAEEADLPEAERRSVVGWARVATGRETCAWCLMLISRGAELNHKGNFGYQEAATAGLALDDETVVDLWNESGGDLAKFKAETAEFMEEWHAGCDCLAVPVFDIEDWPGRDSAKRALQLWIDASKEARRLIESDEARSSNKNTETLNALRRRLERGDLNSKSYALDA